MNESFPRAVAPVLVLVLAAGCAKGSVKLEDQDRFGKMRSAVWLEMTQDTGSESYTSHSFLAASRGGVCQTMQEAMPEIADAYEDLVESFNYSSSSYSYDTGGYVERDLSELCEAYKDYFERVADALDPMMSKGVNTLSFTLRDPDDDAEDEPPSDDYEAGYDNDDPYFTGGLAYYDENPYRVVAESVDCNDNDWYDEGEDAFDDVDAFTIDDGDLVAEQSSDGESYKIDMDGDLEDDDRDNAGDIVFKGKFTKCEVEWDGYAYIYGFGSGSSYSGYDTGYYR